MSYLSRIFVVTILVALASGGAAAGALVWHEASPAAPWGNRVTFTLDSFQGALVLTGGSLGASTFLHHRDVWLSTDGSDWTQAAGVPPWSARREHVSLVFDDTLWLLAGRTYEDEEHPTHNRAHDVWATENSVSWSLVQEAPWTGRIRPAACVFDDRMWIVGGVSDDGYLNDVWSSPDGVNWVEQTSAAPWSARYAPCLIAFHGKMWLMGGMGEQDFNDVWSTPNGIDWTLERLHADWSPRRGHSVVSFENRLWLLGGRVFSEFNSSEVWSSEDGINWQLDTANAPWGRRSAHSCTVHDGRLWFMGGEEFYKENRMCDVWYAELDSGEVEGEEIEGEEIEGQTGDDSLLIKLATTTSQYLPGRNVDLVVRFEGTPTAPLTALGAQIFLPDGWTYAGNIAGTLPSLAPEVGQAGTLEFAYLTPPTLPFEFNLAIQVPEPETGPKLLGGIGLYRTDSVQQETPFTVLQYEEGQRRLHSADTDADGRLSLGEVLRGVQFYNSHAYHCSPGTEDGYAPGTGPSCEMPHDSDYAPQNWRFDLTELLRLIQFYNNGGYVACMSGEDGFCPL